MPADPEPVAALAYQNRRGETYSLHVTTTKNGKPRYRGAKSIGPGALASMPEGYEFSESVNGVVSVRRVLAASECAPAADLALVQAELARHPHLRRHHVRDEKGELVVYEPVGRSQRYDAVMKFVPSAGGPTGRYAVYRWRYSGFGSWFTISGGELPDMVRRYVPAIGTEAFFELM